MKLYWKRGLLILAALLLVVTMVVGCAPEEKPTIKVADAQWESLWIINAVFEYIAENGYGYPVETIEMNTTIAAVSLAEGEVDLWVEMWEQNWQDVYDEAIAEGKIENMGPVFEGGPQVWIIPQWMADEYNIKTVYDMKDHWELFKDPEDPDKGVFISCIPGWECEEINEVKFEAYGLTEYYNIIAPGSGGALDAALVGAQKKGDPVFGYYWAPTAIMGAFDWYVLEEPPYNEAVWEKITAARTDKSLRPLAEACAYEVLPVNKGIHPQLRDKAPELVDVMDKMEMGLDAVNKLASWSLENEVQDYTLTAVYYLENWESTWQTWVTEDAYKKIKEALAQPQ